MTSEPSLAKADFDDIYDQPDPRAYYGTLEPFDYLIPQHGADVFARLRAAREAEGAHLDAVLDICCSYGVVGMLLKTGLRLTELNAHYRGLGADAGRDDVLAADRALLAGRSVPDAPRVVGLDIAERAVSYAVEAGAMDDGLVENLEEAPPSVDLADRLGGVDLILTTGGVGYVTEKTFDRLIDVTPASVWVAAFCLRTYDYAPIAERLEGRGLVTEQVAATFPQRRFTGPEERRWALDEVRRRGLDPAGLESEGSYHAELFVSRPADEAARTSLADLLPL